jgi:hypothetical protein
MVNTRMNDFNVDDNINTMRNALEFLLNANENAALKILKHLIKCADAEHLEIMCTTAAEEAGCGSIESFCSCDIMFTRTKKRKADPRASSSLLAPPTASFTRLVTFAAREALVTHFLPLLDLPTHINLAHCSNQLMRFAGFPIAARNFTRKAAWDKHVDLPLCFNHELARFLEFAPLTSVGVSMCEDRTLKELRVLNGMKQLILSRCKNVTDEGLEQLMGIQLERLDIRKCDKLTDEGLLLLADMPMRHLDLYFGQHITDVGLAKLNTMPLTYLDLDCFARITNMGLMHLHGMQLTYLGLNGALLISSAGLVALHGMPLQTLKLNRCTEIGNIGLKHLKDLPLQHLEIAENLKFTDMGLTHLKNMPLRHLNLDSCFSLTDGGMVHLLELPLEHLSLAECDISDAGLQHLQSLKLLKYLNIRSSIMVTDVGLSYLADLPLRHVVLDYCVLITDAGLEHFTDAPLKTLSNKGCISMTADGYRQFCDQMDLNFVH